MLPISNDLSPLSSRFLTSLVLFLSNYISVGLISIWFILSFNLFVFLINANLINFITNFLVIPLFILSFHYIHILQLIIFAVIMLCSRIFIKMNVLIKFEELSFFEARFGVRKETFVYLFYYFCYYSYLVIIVQ